jgi:hypothetical protein
MQVEVAIFCQPIAQLWGLASDNSSNSAEISSAELPPERPAYPRSTVGNCRGALPSTTCATFRETRFVQCGLAVTRFRHVLTRLVRTYASREAGGRLC